MVCIYTGVNEDDGPE